MAKSVLSDPRFHSEEAAFEYVEAQLWPNGPVCPHCGARRANRPADGQNHPAGLRKCYACRKPFTVRIGTIFEDSHLPLRLWLQAIHLLCASKKGISTRQLQRMLGCGMKTAWHLGHRIRFAMAPGGSLGRWAALARPWRRMKLHMTSRRKTRKRPARSARPP